jgi:SH3-like domain-containing protein
MTGSESMPFGVRRAFAALALVCALGVAAWPLSGAAEDPADPPEEAPAAAAAPEEAPAATAPEETAAPAAASGASGASKIKTSGLPVPRFVSIRSNAVNARTGPSTKYPIEWVFSRRGMPVEVVAEFDTWRRIRDRDGSEGWVMQGMLSSKRSVMVIGDIRTLRRDPLPEARPIARAEAGVIGPLLHCKDDWCEIDAGGYRGWLRRAELWGVYPTERLE